MFLEIYQIVIMLVVFGFALYYTYRQGYYQACFEVANGIIIVKAEEDE